MVMMTVCDWWDAEAGLTVTDTEEWLRLDATVVMSLYDGVCMMVPNFATVFVLRPIVAMLYNVTVLRHFNQWWLHSTKMFYLSYLSRTVDLLQ